MADPFAEFGGKATQPAATDPFAEFGGKAVSPPVAGPSTSPLKPAVPSESPSDPFAQFGGKATPPAEPAPIPERPSDEQGGIFLAGDNANQLTDDDVTRIASATGADPEFVRSSGSFYGLRPSGEGYLESTGKSMLGRAGDSLLGGLPQDAIKKFGISDEKQRRALDEIERLRDQRRTYTAAAGDMLTSGAVALGTGSVIGTAAKGLATAAKLAPNVAKWIGTGANVASNAAQGYLGSDEDNEILGTTAMAALGLAAGPVMKGASKAIGAGKEALGKVKKTAAEILFDDTVGQIPVEKVAAKFAANTNAEEALARRVLSADDIADFDTFKASLTPAEADMLAGLSSSGKATNVAGSVVDSEIDGAVKSSLGLDGSEDAYAKAYSLYKTTRKQLGSALGSGGAKGTAGEAIGREGEEFAARRLQAIRKAEYLADELKEVSGGKELGDFGWGRRLFSWVADARYVYDMIDNRFGTEMAPALDKLSQAYNASTQVQTAALNQFKPIAKALRKVAKTTADGTDIQVAIRQAIDSGDFSKLDTDQAAAAKQLADYFKTAADISESAHELFPQLDIAPIKIQRRENYIPHALVDLPEMVVRLRSRIAAEGDNLADDTKKGLELFYGSDISNSRDMGDALAKLASGKRSADAVRSSAGNLFERSDMIPEFLLENDLFKLATTWPSRTLRHQFLRQGLGELLSASDALGDISPVLSEYVRNHAKDMLGTRSGTAADMTRQLSDKIKIWATERSNAATSPVSKTIFNTIGRLDDLNAAATANMYSYYLGLRPDAVLRNLASVVTMTSTGLDLTKPKDVMPRIIGAYTKASRDVGDGFFSKAGSKAEKDLAAAGYIPADRLYEAQSHLRTGIAQSAPGQWTKDKVNALADISMKLYTTADTITRSATRNMAEGIARDAMSGNEAALSHIVRVSPGYLSAIRRAMKAGDVDKVVDLYSNYLLSSTQFNYNRVSMSQMGRSMGHLFSMFSKWPTAVLGEIGGYVDSKMINRAMPAATGKILARYLMPLALTVAVQKLWWEDAQEDVPAPVRALVGKDIRKWFPSDTLGSLIEGKVAKGAPVLVTGKDSLSKMYDGDPEGALGILADGAMGAIPLGTWLRFFMQTLPELIDGEPILDLRGDKLINKATE